MDCLCEKDFLNEFVQINQERHTAVISLSHTHTQGVITASEQNSHESRVTHS